MNKIGLILGGVAVAVNAAAELPQLTYPVAERQDVVCLLYTSPSPRD